MDKPRHPLVTRPWKTQQTQRNKWNAPPLKAGEGRFDPKGPKIPSSTNAKRERRAIGDSGLLMLKEFGCIDLGFRLGQPYWGKGLATEVASVWVRAAFDDFHINRLTAIVHPENLASIRVLEKLGFLTERRDTIMGMNSIVFSLSAKDGGTDSCFRRRMDGYVAKY
jgi:RimJ/RimL family protein N-acetyltransferase